MSIKVEYKAQKLYEHIWSKLSGEHNNRGAQGIKQDLILAEVMKGELSEWTKKAIRVLVWKIHPGYVKFVFGMWQALQS